MDRGGAIAAGAPGGLDTVARLVTPERVEFLYPLAGPFRRAAAYLVDLAAIFGLAVAGAQLATALALGTGAGRGLALAILFALTWGYGAIQEGFCNGRTLGKRALGLRVMAVEGVPIAGAQAALRNLLGAVDGPFPFAYLPGLASMALTARFQRLGDLAAGTMVVVERPRSTAAVPMVEPEAIAGVLPLLPLRVSAGPGLARALSDYVGARPRFGPDRREEIARHLAGPIRERHGLPAGATADAVLCAFYHRLFRGE